MVRCACVLVWHPVPKSPGWTSGWNLGPPKCWQKGDDFPDVFPFGDDFSQEISHASFPWAARSPAMDGRWRCTPSSTQSWVWRTMRGGRAEGWEGIPRVLSREWVGMGGNGWEWDCSEEHIYILSPSPFHEQSENAFPITFATPVTNFALQTGNFVEACLDNFSFVQIQACRCVDPVFAHFS